MAFKTKARQLPANGSGVGNTTQHQRQPHAIRKGENLFDCDSAQKSLKPAPVMLALQDDLVCAPANFRIPLR